MTRDDLLTINSSLRDTIDDIEDILTDLDLSAQSSLNTDELGDDNSHLQAALVAIIKRASDGLSEIEDDDGDED